MSTWRYCENCKVGMYPPTDGEVVIGIGICHNCGTEHDFIGDNKERIEKIDSIVERLNRLDFGVGS